MEKRLNEIEGFENCDGYIIHDNGMIYSEYKKDFLKPCKDSKGYLYLDLRSKNAKYKCPKVHRLIMNAFVGEENDKQINHIDGNKENNNLNNLEYVTNKENRIHAIQNGLKNEINYGIEQYDLEGNKLNTFNTCQEAIEYLGLESGNPGNIGRVIRGNRKTAYGYVWKNCESSTTIESIAA